MVDGRGGEGSGGEVGSMEDYRRHWRQRGQPHTGLRCMDGQKKKAARGGGQSTDGYGGRTVPKT